MLKRPQPGETDEDLLRMQEEFLASPAAAPSAKLIKMTPPSDTSQAAPQPAKRDVVEFGGELVIQEKHQFNILMNLHTVIDLCCISREGEIL